MENFTSFGFAPVLNIALEAEGYRTPTPIQAKAIPHVMEGRDLLGIAQTGTGKTAAFALPILHRLASNPQAAPRKGCRALVLSPTRELASQIAESFRTLGAGQNLRIATVFGGVSYTGQIKNLARGVDVLVATAGRLVDLLDSGVADLRSTEILVLDEVDQMLDMGFIAPIRRILRDMPIRRQSLFFSATMPPESKVLANEMLSDPVEVSVTPVASTVDRIEQRVILVEARRKQETLTALFNEEAMTRTIVFTRTKYGADRVAQNLERAGIMAQAIHGNKSQNQRERALSAFRAGKISVLVATDIAARGIDVSDVTHVVNYELPEIAERYVHRIGRTARAGAEGCAVSLCDHAERGLLRDIEKLIQRALPLSDRRSEENRKSEGEYTSGLERKKGKATSPKGRKTKAQGRKAGAKKPVRFERRPNTKREDPRERIAASLQAAPGDVAIKPAVKSGTASKSPARSGSKPNIRSQGGQAPLRRKKAA